MKKFFFFILFVLIDTKSIASNKDAIILNLKEIENISFNFEQNINGKIENGICILQYPKQIYCKYDLKNKKILVSNGKSLVIKTKNSYYIYPLDKTPLHFILDKNYLIEKISKINERVIENKFINFKFIENDAEINIFFNKKDKELIGWQTLDIYQNLSITFLSSIKKNQNLDQNIFKLPKQD